MNRTVRIAPVLAIILSVLVLGPRAEATSTKLTSSGQAEFTYGATVDSAGGAATGQKPESKLFYTGDGSTEAIRWWGVLGTSGPSPAPGVWLFQLVNHTWAGVLRLPGADPWSKADTVFDGS